MSNNEQSDLREIRKLLAENLEESKRTRKKLENHIKWTRIFTVAKYLIITGVLAFAILELLPFLEPLVDLFHQFMSGSAR